MRSRYAPQIALSEVGESGQEALQNLRVLVVGAGGLGGALLPWLAAAGVGTGPSGWIRVADPDRVEESNLQRQVLYDTSQVGGLKAELARERLLALNPHLHVEALCFPLSPSMAAPLVAEADIVVDAADNFATTYMLNDQCQRLSRPFVSGSAVGWQGYVGVFCAGEGEGYIPSYRAVFPHPAGGAEQCGEQGILGPVVGIIGALQAQLVLSLCLHRHTPESVPSPAGVMHFWEGRRARLSRFDFRTAPEPAPCWHFISLSDLGADDVVLDVRPPEAFPRLTLTQLNHASYRSVPLEKLSQQREIGAHSQDLGRWGKDSRLVLACNTGARALAAAALLPQSSFALLALDLETR